MTTFETELYFQKKRRNRYDTEPENYRFCRTRLLQQRLPESAPGNTDRPQGADTRTPDPGRRPGRHRHRGGRPSGSLDGLYQHGRRRRRGQTHSHRPRSGRDRHLLHDPPPRQLLACRLLLDRSADRETQHSLDPRHPEGTPSLRTGHGPDPLRESAPSGRAQHRGGHCGGGRGAQSGRSGQS